MSLEREKDRYSRPTSAEVGLVTWGDAGLIPCCAGVGGRDQCGQATKGMWGMSWHRQAMKGVEDCDKPGGAVKQALIPGFPNERALNP